MNHTFDCTSSLLIAAALGALVSTSSAAEAQACTSASATNDAHVAAGRATTSTTANCSACVFGICGFPSGCDTSTKAYLAVGSNENLGSSGTQVTTLYQSGSVYRTTPPATELSCTDKLDNDCDGKVDCDDTQCSSDPACAVQTLRWVSVTGAAFVSKDPTDYGDGWVSPNSAAWSGIAPLSLPDGAVVRELRCSMRAGYDVTVTLGQVILLDASLESETVLNTGETLSISGATGWIKRRTTITRLPPMDNQTSVRSIVLSLNYSAVPLSRTSQFKGCTVGYTL